MNIKPEEAMVATGVARTSTSPEFASALRSASEWFAGIERPRLAAEHPTSSATSSDDCVLKEIAVPHGGSESTALISAAARASLQSRKKDQRVQAWLSGHAKPHGNEREQRKLQVRDRHLRTRGKAIQRDIAALMSRFAGDFGPKPRRWLEVLGLLLAFKLDRENITALGIYDTVKLNLVTAGAALDGEMEPIIGDLPDAEVEQRLGMSPGNRG
jgi:hypothetical protein